MLSRGGTDLCAVAGEGVVRGVQGIGQIRNSGFWPPPELSKYSKSPHTQISPPNIWHPNFHRKFVIRYPSPAKTFVEAGAITNSRCKLYQ